MMLIVIYHKIHGNPCRQIDLQQTHSLPKQLHAWWCLIGNSNKGNHKIQTKDAIGLCLYATIGLIIFIRWD